MKKPLLPCHRKVVHTPGSPTLHPPSPSSWWTPPPPPSASGPRLLRERGCSPSSQCCHPRGQHWSTQGWKCYREFAESSDSTMAFLGLLAMFPFGNTFAGFTALLIVSDTSENRFGKRGHRTVCAHCGPGERRIHRTGVNHSGFSTAWKKINYQGWTFSRLFFCSSKKKGLLWGGFSFNFWGAGPHCHLVPTSYLPMHCGTSHCPNFMWFNSQSSELPLHLLSIHTSLNMSCLKNPI